MQRLARLSSRSLAAAGGAVVAVSALNFASGPILADEGKSTAVVSSRKKLSIYAAPTPPIHITRTESELANQIGVAREYGTARYIEGRDGLQGWVNGWIAFEGKVERQVKEIIPKDEPMTPGLLYVGIATLTGSVLGRNRSAPIRILLPPIALVTSLAYFLPKTYTNLSSYTSSLESTYAPSLHKSRLEFQQSISQSLGNASRTYSSTKDSLGQNIKWARKEVEDKTGLKVGDHKAGSETTATSTIVEQAKGAFVKVQEETKKLGQQASGAVEGAVEEVKIKADKILGEPEPASTPKEEEPPKRLV